MKLEYTGKTRRQKSNTKKLEDPGRQTNVTANQRGKIRQIKVLKKNITGNNSYSKVSSMHPTQLYIEKLRRPENSSQTPPKSKHQNQMRDLQQVFPIKQLPKSQRKVFEKHKCQRSIASRAKKQQSRCTDAALSLNQLPTELHIFGDDTKRKRLYLIKGWTPDREDNSWDDPLVFGSFFMKIQRTQGNRSNPWSFRHHPHSIFRTNKRER